MRISGILIGYHNCAEEVARRVILGREPLKPGIEEHDWLGPGTYFWENSLERAKVWSPYYSRKSQSANRCVVGVAIDARNCLDLLDKECVDLVVTAYRRMVRIYEQAGVQLPENEPGSTRDLQRSKRLLDFQVLKHVHKFQEEDGEETFDVVRGAFPEGLPIYPGAELYSQTHIQLCVRDPKCILGYFLPPGTVL